MNTKRSFAMAAALCAAASATTAFAEPVSQSVPIGDLNLGTTGGRSALQARVDKAARDVCRYDAEGYVLPPEITNACYRATRRELEIRMAGLIGTSQNKA